MRNSVSETHMKERLCHLTGYYGMNRGHIVVISYDVKLYLYGQFNIRRRYILCRTEIIKFHGAIYDQNLALKNSKKFAKLLYAIKNFCPNSL